MKWVKAIDEIPEKNNTVCCKHNKIYFEGWIPKDLEMFTDAAGNYYCYDGLEWLDEGDDIQS